MEKNEQNIIFHQNSALVAAWKFWKCLEFVFHVLKASEKIYILTCGTEWMAKTLIKVIINQSTAMWRVYWKQNNWNLWHFWENLFSLSLRCLFVDKERGAKWSLLKGCWLLFTSYFFCYLNFLPDNTKKMKSIICMFSRIIKINKNFSKNQAQKKFV